MKKIEKPIKLKDHLIKYESELTYKYKIIELEQKMNLFMLMIILNKQHNDHLNDFCHMSAKNQSI